MATPSPVPQAYLPFEQGLKEIDELIRKLEDWARTNSMDVSEELNGHREKREELLRRIYQNLTAWDRIQVSRHTQRPQTRDYIAHICTDFVELHGDRSFSDDNAIVTGLATVGEHRLMLIGQHKGRDVHERSFCNFGMPQPEGYRKALWKMRLAEKFKIPVLCLIDTKGAAPDLGAEERGQSQAIAYNLQVMSGLKVPILCIVIGEGGSGGALSIGVGDRLLIQENAYFSVISPEGCASILWKDSDRKADAAEALRITAPELKNLGVVDEIIPEPLGGAHRDPKGAAEMLKATIDRCLKELNAKPLDVLLEERYQRLRSMGKYQEAALAAAAGT
ncbi:MAG: acetyl-CoA carboxylase carboxyltransferase subunit alpha [Planctomycetota bacterium]|nr:acetyl-CoA carboxylase carboxyltransferase subunit alpha [Planctomycetota bacterium]